MVWGTSKLVAHKDPPLAVTPFLRAETFFFFLFLRVLPASSSSLFRSSPTLRHPHPLLSYPIPLQTPSPHTQSIMDAATPAVNGVDPFDADRASVSKLHPFVGTPATSDLNNAIEGQPTYQTNSAKSNATSFPTLRTSTPVPYDSGNLLDKDGPAFTVTTTSTRARKPSISDTLLEGASSVVAAARRLVLHDDEDALEGENVEAAHTGTDASGSSSSILPSFFVPDATAHHGLEFSQRRLSIERSRKTSGQGSSFNHATGSLGGSEARVASSGRPDSRSGLGLGSGSSAGSVSGAGSASGAVSGSDEVLASGVGLASGVALALGAASGSGAESSVGAGSGSGSALKSGIDEGSKAGNSHQKQSSQSETTAAHVSSSGADRITVASSGIGQV